VLSERDRIIERLSLPILVRLPALPVAGDTVPSSCLHCAHFVDQGRRHGFESGVQILRAKRAENLLTPHFLATAERNVAYSQVSLIRMFAL